MTFGENLKWLRARAKASQSAFSTLTGIPQGSICKYEQGRIFPSAKTFEALENLAALPAFTSPEGNALKPAWFAPTVIRLPHAQFLAHVGLDEGLDEGLNGNEEADASPPEDEKPADDSASDRTRSRTSGGRGAETGGTTMPPPHDREQSHSPPPRAPLKASTIHQPHWIDGIYVALRYADNGGGLLFDVFGFQPDGGNRLTASITRLGREPTVDRSWGTEIYQHPPYTIVIVGETTNEPRELAIWRLAPPPGDEPPYSRLVGRLSPVEAAFLAQRADTRVALFRIDGGDTSRHAIGRLRDPNDSLSAELRDAFFKLERDGLIR